MKPTTHSINKLRYSISIPAVLSIAVLLILIFLPSICFGQDPAGATTGNLNDVAAAKAGKPTLEEIGAQAGHNKIAINIMWTLITGFLVMFMQAGFAMVETGFTQRKNVAHTMAMNFLVYALGVLGFWICGFAFMFGGGLNVASLGGAAGVTSNEFSVHLFGHDFGLWGNAGYFLNSSVYDVGIFT